MKVIEQNITGKTGDIDKCEDRIVVTNDFACIIDGVTSKSTRLIDNLTTGKFASLVIEEAINELPHDAGLPLTVELVTKKLETEYRIRNIYKQLLSNSVERPSAALAIYSRYYQQVWLIGDCQCIVDGIKYTNEKKIDIIAAEARALYIELELLKGKKVHELLGNDDGRQFIMPLLKNQALFQNTLNSHEYSYEVIDGFKLDVKKVKKIDVIGEELVLSSDGYPKLFATLSESEKYLEKVIEEDPLLFRIHKSTKGVVKGNVSFDDRAYIRLKV